MNTNDSAELQELERRQALLLASVKALSADIERLKCRVPSPAPLVAPRTQTVFATAKPPVAVPPPLPPILPPVPQQSANVETVSEPRKPEANSVAAILKAHMEAEAGAEMERQAAVGIKSVDQPDQGSFAARTAAAAPANTSFEMKLGTYWLVRIGIVLLLTGLVFLGNYAYKNFIGKLGAGGKVTLLYAAGGLLLAAGAWLQRKREKESLRNYGQVLFAGGLAAVYFTTYAAHHLPALRIIASPVLDGLFLLAWGAFTAWLADRRKSEVLALFAVGLSYYTSAITDVGAFTLYSNLVLSGAAVFFLVRNRWTTLSFVSLAATYIGFVFWRFHAADWIWNWSAQGNLWTGNFYLAGYWLFFTAAVFLSRGTVLVNGARALFATLNNAAFFGLVLLSMRHSSTWEFWRFALIYGAVLLVCARLAARWLSHEAHLQQSYMVQGLVLITAGFVAYFTGLKLALVLAAESVVLTVLGQQRKSAFMQAGGCITAAMALVWTVLGLSQTPKDLLVGASITAAFLINGWCIHYASRRNEAESNRALCGYFSALAVLLTAIIVWHATPVSYRAVAWIAAALVYTGSFYLLRMRELPLFAQGLALLAQCYWFFTFAITSVRPHWSVPVLLIGGTLILSHWWQRQKALSAPSHLGRGLQLIYALAVVGVLFFWLQPKFAPSAWLVFLNAIAIALTLYGVLTRAWMLAAAAQLFLLISAVEFLDQLAAAGSRPTPLYALAPIVTLLLLGIVTTAWLSRNEIREPVKEPLLQVSGIYRAIAFLMSIWWVYAYIAAPHQPWCFVASGLALLVLAGICRARELPAYAGIFIAVGLCTWVSMDSIDRVAWYNAIAIVSVLVAEQVTRRYPERWNIPAFARNATIVIGSAAVWLYVTRLLLSTQQESHLLTVSWALLAMALFAAGFLLRERLYRWTGLAMLGLAIGRVFLFDVWKLATIYRILSFLVLGVVLLVLGFVYNKFQEKVRQWL